MSYFSPAARIAFVGDTAGICRPSGRVVLPPTPPPDIDLEAWRTSTDRILGWHPDQLFLTHFGPQPAPRVHFHDLWTRMDEWSRRVKALLEQPGTDADRARRFTDEVMDELARATNRDEAPRTRARDDSIFPGRVSRVTGAREWSHRSLQFSNLRAPLDFSAIAATIVEADLETHFACIVRSNNRRTQHVVAPQPIARYRVAVVVVLFVVQPSVVEPVAAQDNCIVSMPPGRVYRVRYTRRRV